MEIINIFQMMLYIYNSEMKPMYFEKISLNFVPECPVDGELLLIGVSPRLMEKRE